MLLSYFAVYAQFEQNKRIQTIRSIYNYIFVLNFTSLQTRVHSHDHTKISEIKRPRKNLYRHLLIELYRCIRMTLKDSVLTHQWFRMTLPRFDSYIGFLDIGVQDVAYVRGIPIG